MYQSHTIYRASMLSSARHETTARHLRGVCFYFRLQTQFRAKPMSKGYLSLLGRVFHKIPASIDLDTSVLKMDHGRSRDIVRATMHQILTQF
jgi:hypothetical protein